MKYSVLSRLDSEFKLHHLSSKTIFRQFEKVSNLRENHSRDVMVIGADGTSYDTKQTIIAQGWDSILGLHTALSGMLLRDHYDTAVIYQLR